MKLRSLKTAARVYKSRLKTLIASENIIANNRILTLTTHLSDLLTYLADGWSKSALKSRKVRVLMKLITPFK